MTRIEVVQQTIKQTSDKIPKQIPAFEAAINARIGKLEAEGFRFVSLQTNIGQLDFSSTVYDLYAFLTFVERDPLGSTLLAREDVGMLIREPSSAVTSDAGTDAARDRARDASGKFQGKN